MSHQSLSNIQKRHISKVFPENRKMMAEYLTAAAPVVIYPQKECGIDVDPFAIVVNGTNFWIDCCKTAEKAVEKAEKLGLFVIGTQLHYVCESDDSEPRLSVPRHN